MKYDKWFTYILICNDDTFYCGITNNIPHRLLAHSKGTGAKYTRGRLPVYLAAYWEFDTKSLAAKEEYRIKQLTRKEKRDMIKTTSNFIIN